MSSDLARSMLVMTAIVLQVVAAWQADRDRDRRERETRVRPQPLRYSTAGRVMVGASLVALAGAALTFLA